MANMHIDEYITFTINAYATRTFTNCEGGNCVSRSVQPRIKRSPLSTVASSNPPPAQPTVLENMLKEFRQHGPGRSLGGSFSANLETSIEALWANRTRSILTTLGILIGVAAVIAVLTLTQG